MKNNSWILVMFYMAGLIMGWSIYHSTLDENSRCNNIELPAQSTQYEQVIIPVNPEDVKWLALNIYFEGRSLDPLSQRAIAHVTLNRLLDGRWPNTIKDVVTQKNQFSWFSDGKSDQPKNLKAWNTAQILARDVLVILANDEYYDDITSGSVYYHHETVKPVWRNDLAMTANHGGHIFYR